jgi:hypothetical protein
MNLDKHMPQLENNNPPSQERIDYLRQLYDANVTLAPEESHKLLRSEIFDLESIPANEPAIILASVSKIIFSALYAQMMFENFENLTQYELGFEQLWEVLQRNPAHVLTEAGDSRGQYIALRAHLKNYEGEQLNQLMRVLAGDNTLSKPEVAQFAPVLGKFKSEIQEFLVAHGPLKVSREELLFIVLGLSSNSSTVDVREALEQKLGLAGLIEAVQTLAPSFVPTYTTKENRHYSQYGPNTGKPSEMLKFLSQLVDDALNPASANHQVSAALIEAMANSQEKFGFSFTESEYGQWLISKGYKIIEKTGYLPCVSWDEKSAKELGIAYYMAVEAAVVIIGPDGHKALEFFAYDIIEVKAPTMLAEVTPGEKNSEGKPKARTYTAFSDRTYMNYIDTVEAVVKPDYQQKTVNYVKENIAL